MPLDAGDPGDKRDDAGAAPEGRLDDESCADRALRCAQCGEPITTERAAIEVAGRHAHAFMNPSAVVFHIRCFRAAPGVRIEGDATDAYSWFPGFLWRYAHCAACGLHLGWSYERPPRGTVELFGLISERLVEG